MILKTEAENFLGKRVQFLVYTNEQGTMECRKGILAEIGEAGAVIERGRFRTLTNLERIFPEDKAVPETVDRECLRKLEEEIIGQYVEQMHDMESIIRFPLIYDLNERLPGEAYKRAAEKLTGIKL